MKHHFWNKRVCLGIVEILYEVSLIGWYWSIFRILNSNLFFSAVVTRCGNIVINIIEVNIG